MTKVPLSRITVIPADPMVPEGHVTVPDITPTTIWATWMVRPDGGWLLVRAYSCAGRQGGTRGALDVEVITVPADGERQTEVCSKGRSGVETTHVFKNLVQGYARAGCRVLASWVSQERVWLIEDPQLVAAFGATRVEGVKPVVPDHRRAGDDVVAPTLTFQMKEDGLPEDMARLVVEGRPTVAILLYRTDIQRYSFVWVEEGLAGVFFQTEFSPGSPRTESFPCPPGERPGKVVAEMADLARSGGGVIRVVATYLLPVGRWDSESAEYDEWVARGNRMIAQRLQPQSLVDRFPEWF